MNVHKCIIIDDDEIDRLMITSLVRKFPQLELIGIYNSAEEVLASKIYLDADVLFLDIDMQGMNGLDFRKIANDVPACVFITSHPEYALDSFEVETIDFIVKPVSPQRFEKMVSRLDLFFDIRSKAGKYESHIQEQYIFIKEGHRETKINLNEILYLEALKDYTLIITEQKKHCVLSTIGNLLSKKYFQAFIRVHKSYAVSKSKIETIGNQELKLTNGNMIPLGRKFKDDLKELRSDF